jgi:purine nucleoside phosphorylase
MARAEIGVFGGSGFYSFLEDVDQVEVETPYGKPSAPFTIGDIGGGSVAFLPRHGLNHELPPHAIPFRANVWAMKELGVRRIIGPNASGALKAELELGEFVVCDQFVDRTSGRRDTFYDGPETTHVSAADPFCPDLRALLVETAGELGIKAREAVRSSSSRARASRALERQSGQGNVMRVHAPAASAFATVTTRRDLDGGFLSRYLADVEARSHRLTL